MSMVWFDNTLVVVGAMATPVRVVDPDKSESGYRKDDSVNIVNIVTYYASAQYHNGPVD